MYIYRIWHFAAVCVLFCGCSRSDSQSAAIELDVTGTEEVGEGTSPAESLVAGDAESTTAEAADNPQQHLAPPTAERRGNDKTNTAEPPRLSPLSGHFVRTFHKPNYLKDGIVYTLVLDNVENDRCSGHVEWKEYNSGAGIVADTALEHLSGAGEIPHSFMLQLIDFDVIENDLIWVAKGKTSTSNDVRIEIDKRKPNSALLITNGSFFNENLLEEDISLPPDSIMNWQPVDPPKWKAMWLHRHPEDQDFPPVVPKPPVQPAPGAPQFTPADIQA